jgi:hypothetical protein
MADRFEDLKTFFANSDTTVYLSDSQTVRQSDSQTDMSDCLTAVSERRLD